MMEVTPAGTVNVPLELKVWVWEKEMPEVRIKAPAA
jgi:hypothetical protein